MANAEVVKEALRQIFSGIEMLQVASSGAKKFTIDGRLVGDIGEIVAARDYELVLEEKQRSRFDARTADGREIQIKATFQNSLTFRSETMFYLGLKLERDGTYREIFNGPGSLVADSCRHLKGFGNQLVSIPIGRLEKLSAEISLENRIARKQSATRR